MQDGTSSVNEPLEEVELSSNPNTKKPISISSRLTADKKQRLTSLLKEYQDVFAWNYKEMPGLNPEMVCHSLNVETG